MFEKIGLQLLQKIDAELAHDIGLLYLRTKPFFQKHHPSYPRLTTHLAGMHLPNPLGLAAGFDKNAVAVKALSQLGLGFMEVGAATPLPQRGNAKPRVFRLKTDRAIVNHYGFNNDGMIRINKRLEKFAKRSIIGLNIGANKNSVNMANDFTKVLTVCSGNIHFATLNISSPNTKNLRDFQNGQNLRELLSVVVETNKGLLNPIPIFIKISPDLSYKQLEEIVKLACQYKIKGIIATNTSIDHKMLTKNTKFLKGGVSGKPLFTKSTKTLAMLSVISDGQIPLIGVGGVFSGEDAYKKICAGATVIQLYSALAFFGPGLIQSILFDLNKLLESRGFAHISEAIGTAKHEFK